MEKKILYISYKRYNSILEGGGMGHLRSLRTITNHFGKENVVEEYVMDEAKKTSPLKRIVSAYYILLNYHNRLTPERVDEIVEKAHNFEHVFIDTSVLGIIAKKLKEGGYQGNIIVHFHNIESIYYDACIPRWFPGRQFIIRCAANNDRYACQFADKIITLSKRDSDYLEHHYSRKGDVIIGTGIKDRLDETNVDTTKLTASKPSCMFLGAYFGPNKDGVIWFVKNVLPHVNIRFRIVGKDMDKLKLPETYKNNIEILSNVPVLDSLFQETDFMILPLFSGSGMKIKTGESMMFGKNIIGTSEAFAGYHVNTNLIGGCCNTAEEFIERINHFITTPTYQFNQYARDMYLKYYSEESTSKLFCSVFY